MRYIFVTALVGVGLLVLAGPLDAWGWPLYWLAADFFLVSVAYAGLGPRVFGKRPDGRLAWWAVLPLLPYLLLTWALWHLIRRLSREDCCNEAAPGLWLGRRPLAREVPPGVSLLVDLTAEFAAAPAVRGGRTYICLPTLDTRAPDERTLRELVDRLADWPGAVYIYCAQGHGRSALTAAVLLLRRGLAKDGKHAVALLRRARPRVQLQRVQRRLLERFTASA